MLASMLISASGSVQPDTSWSSQMPFPLTSAVQPPPQTPRISLVSSQSQSPSGCSKQPQSKVVPGPLQIPHSSSSPTHLSSLSQMPSPSMSSAPAATIADGIKDAHSVALGS